MGSQYIPPPEQNVVNVDDEISINALNGIAQANPAITSTNPVATNNSVSTAISGKADLSGASFTGNVTTTGRIGIGGPVPVNAQNKLGVYDGNIVFSAGYGLAFGDGTTLTSANSLGAHTHVIGDITGLQTALNGKADISGATFTGKVNTSVISGAAGFNIGIGGLDTSSTTPGDMWIPASGQTLNYRDALGNWRQVLTTSTSGVIQVSSTLPALRVTQTGAGESFRVEDSASPDSSAFVISASGRVGVGVTPDTIAAINLDSGGIKYSDGTTQTSARGLNIRQWVRFDGSLSTPSVIAGNATSVTKLATGAYRIDFSTAFSNTTYGVQISGKRAGLNEPVIGYAITRNVSWCEIRVGVGSFTQADSDDIAVTFLSGNT